VLSWREQTLFVIDAKDFTLKNVLAFEGQGWGLATNGQVLIRSDGSEKIYFHDKYTFNILSDITVTENNLAVKNINELEFIDGFIWANVWHENRIIKIDPKTGVVVGTANLQPLVDDLALIEPESVLNGIAYDSVQDAIWVTGKNWPKMYLLKIK
jgi:glutamine cyclotransferase